MVNIIKEYDKIETMGLWQDKDCKRNGKDIW